MNIKNKWLSLWKYFRRMLLILFLCLLIVLFYGLSLVLREDYPLSKTEDDLLNFETEMRRDFSSAEELKLFKARDLETLSYRFYDSQGSRTLIFLHGSSYHGLYLHTLAEYLSQNDIAKVCLPNLRGHYFSGKRRGDIDYIGQYEDDIADLIDELTLQGSKGAIYLGGHSSGAGLAIRFAGGPHHDLVKGYVLISPMIPLAPTNKEGTGGGWARLYQKRMQGLTILNLLGITGFNALPIIEFNKPGEFWDGTETLCYSYRLNTSYHPRYKYQQDLEALEENYLLLIGERDEVNSPERFPEVFQNLSEENYFVLPAVNHLNIVHHSSTLEKISRWFERSEKEDLPFSMVKTKQ